MFGESVLRKFTKFVVTKSRGTEIRGSTVDNRQSRKEASEYGYFRVFRFVLLVSAVGMLVFAGLAVGGVAAQDPVEMSDAQDLQQRVR